MIILCCTGYAAAAQTAPDGQPVSKALAEITLSHLEQIYDGAPKRAEAATEPPGLAVSFTYDGKAAAPTKAGTYTVVGTVEDAHYEGRATGVLMIAKAGQNIVFNVLAARTYGDGPFALSSRTSSGLITTYESSNHDVVIVSGNRVKIVEAGSAEITAYQAGDDNYLPAEPVKRVLTVNKGKANVALRGLLQTYDGAPKNVGLRTEPTGLKVAVTYDDSESAPTNAGVYAVTATVRDDNYEGSATAKMTIARASQKIIFNAPAVQTYGNAALELSSSVSSGLTATYESSNAAVATVSGDMVTITGAGSTWITAYQAGDENHLPAKAVQQKLISKKAAQSIAFNGPVIATYGDPDFSPGATANSGLPVLFKSTNPKVAAIVGNSLHIVGAGSAAITASQAGDKNHLPAKPVTQTLTVNKAKARIFLTGLEQTYDGSPKTVTAETVPGGLSVTVTYNDDAAAPARTGSYMVFGRIEDANYEGVVTATLTISKADQKITFDSPVAATYGDADFTPAATATSGLPVSYASSNPKVATIVENRVHIVGAGSSTITASQPGDDNYLAAKSATQTLTVNKARANVIITDLGHTYDGMAKRAGAKTEPEGLLITLTYEGSATAPVNAGSYAVLGTVEDANYEGSAVGTLTIAKAAQSISFGTLAARTYGEGPFVLAAAVSSGLTATFESSNPRVAIVSGSMVRIAGAGTAEITAHQGGDHNYEAAEPMKQILIVNKAKAKVMLMSLDQTYDGAPKSAGAKTEPQDLTVTFSYEGGAAVPVNAGSYRVLATVEEANYEGSAEGTLSVARAPQTITFAALAARTYGDAPFALAAAVTSGLTATFESSNSAVAAISGDNVTIAGAGTTEITAYQAGDENHLAAEPVKQALTVEKAIQSIAFNAPLTMTYGDADFSPGAASSGLSVSYTSSDPSVAIVVENHIRIVGTGSSTIIASQPGDNNYRAAEPVTQLLTVNKVKAKVTITRLDQAYDGTAKRAWVATEPKGLSVTVTYDGRGEAPVKAGAYAVAATIQDANYEGSETATLTVAKAPQQVVFDALPILTDGDRPLTLYSWVSSGLTATYGSSNTAVATIRGSSVTIAGAGTAEITAYQAGDNNYRAAEPVKQVLIVRAVPRHIAVLPIVNVSGQPAPAKEMRQKLIEWLVAEGAEVLDDQSLEKFMARHRIRNVDGIDGDTARALREETGMDAVVVTILERYVDTDRPAIAMASRLVSAEETPIILWMETASFWGGDAPGLLGLGLIKDIAALRKMALDRITGSLKKYLAGGATNVRSQRGDSISRPKTVYSTPFMFPGKKYSIAVAPFLNASEQNDADSFVALHFMCQLTKAGIFNVIDPGSVRDKLLSFRMIMQEGLSMRQADLIHDTLNVDLILAGRVNAYREVEGSPKVEFGALVFERKKKKVVWESWSFNRGDEGASFFAWGKVNTADALASKMTQAVVSDLRVQGTFPPGQLPKEKPSRRGPWSLD
jgi:TolB-like protein